MRYVIYGAGGIGGGIGGRLHQHGHDVTLIARGAHHDAIRDDGLRLADPDGEERRAVPRIMRAKYGKLLLNLGNAIEALTGERAFGVGQLYERARAEADACYAAAGIEAVTAEEDQARRVDLPKLRPAGGKARSKGS